MYIFFPPDKTIILFLSLEWQLPAEGGSFYKADEVRTIRELEAYNKTLLLHSVSI